MALQKDEEIRKTKIFIGTALKYGLSESKEDSFRRLNEKNPEKFKRKLSEDIQKNMRIHTAEIISGSMWEEDFNEIFAEVVKLYEEVE